jgi:dephospho-CoA kinase
MQLLHSKTSLNYGLTSVMSGGKGSSLCFLDVPLLFEAGWQVLCTKVIVAVAPFVVEEARLRQRGLTDGEIAGMLARQWPTARKTALADYCIDTSGSKQQTLQQLIAILGEIANA